MKIPLAEDSFSFLRALFMLSEKTAEDHTPPRISQISVRFYGLVPADKIIQDTFEELDDPIEKIRKGIPVSQSRWMILMQNIALVTVCLAPYRKTYQALAVQKSPLPVSLKY